LRAAGLQRLVPALLRLRLDPAGMALSTELQVCLEPRCALNYWYMVCQLLDSVRQPFCRCRTNGLSCCTADGAATGRTCVGPGLCPNLTDGPAGGLSEQWSRLLAATAWCRWRCRRCWRRGPRIRSGAHRCRRWPVMCPGWAQTTGATDMMTLTALTLHDTRLTGHCCCGAHPAIVATSVVYPSKGACTSCITFETHSCLEPIERHHKPQMVYILAGCISQRFRRCRSTLHGVLSCGQPLLRFC
jgi:hypothetical protein